MSDLSAFVEALTKKAKRPKPIAHEAIECKTLNQYLGMIAPRHGVKFSHIANGGMRHQSVANELKAMGVVAGVWDYIFRKAGLPVVWLEMKWGSNNLEQEQEDWRDALHPCGDVFIAAWTAVDALAALQAVGLFPPDAFQITAGMFRVNLNYPIIETQPIDPATAGRCFDAYDGKILAAVKIKRRPKLATANTLSVAKKKRAYRPAFRRRWK